MAFGNRLINTESGGSGSDVLGATLANLDFNFSNTYNRGMDAYDGTMYNVTPANSRLLAAGTWENEGTLYTANYSNTGSYNGISRAEDGTFWVGDQSQTQVRRFSFTGQNTISLLNNFSIAGRVWDVTAIPDGFAYTDTDASVVRVYDNTGSFVNSFTPSEGVTSQANGLTWDGGSLWVSCGNTSGGQGVVYKYDLSGNYLGLSFNAWADRPFSMLGYDQINSQFYGFNNSSFGFFGGTAARYNAILP